MLLLFAVSVTPKQLLHDAITGHKHSYLKFEGDLKIQTSKNNFQCNWHNDVIESPFTDQPYVQFDHSFPVYTSYINHYTCRYYSAEQFFSPLRGPPSLL
jgi:hypothetical protein